MEEREAGLSAEDPEDTEPQATVSLRDGRFRKQASRSLRKAQRQSRPATVLAALGSTSKDVYMIAPPGKKDLSYSRLYAPKAREYTQQEPQKPPLEESKTRLREPVSLYSILARYLKHHAAVPLMKAEFQYTPSELDLLTSRGYTSPSVWKWALCLAEPRSHLASEIFRPGVEMAPLFILLLFLRRKNIRASALTVVMKHLEQRVKEEPISWNVFKILVVRLLRHARLVLPESMPWIASLYTVEAARRHDNQTDTTSQPPRTILDLTKFCNTVLMLLSIPTPNYPIHSAKFQEKAQFKILEYMAGCSPAIVVTKLGFQAVARNQLAHPKTQQEREWAELKGASWPPWKENRTAMDEEKGYEFGASRASKILHRMFEAGYSGGYLEDLAQIYAGWDTDSSPTIQTRTLGPGFRTSPKDVPHLRALLGAARIRTTRTRREAWACFLSHELSDESSHEELYHAMFEKLHRATAERAPPRGFHSDLEPMEEAQATNLMPGDMLEVLPDPVSPLHYVFLSEPVPTYKELLRRMRASGVQPSRRLLAFLLETCPDFETGLGIVDMVRDGRGHALGRLVAGIHLDDQIVQSMPGYLFAAFIRLLCRFGRYERPHADQLALHPPREHRFRLSLDRQYLLEYAYMLLMHYKPRYRPCWTNYIQKLVRHRSAQLAGNVSRYKIVCGVMERMEQLDLDMDDETFLLVCTATIYAVQSVDQGLASLDEERYILTTGSARLRTLFNGLVLASLDSQPIGTDALHIPVHIPGPAQLHAYARALGVLRDYEGLYSFSTWLMKHHVEVTARAAAQHSGSKLLFRTLVALRVAVDGTEQRPEAPADIAQLIRAQVERVEEWGGWPAREYVDMYNQGHLKSSVSVVGGR
ncbi:hypothetical protein T440DRAFT_489188 [Plenodomus tracheiphilus IPT5]|uniref:Uncharacterized protein n=1 Tax=Plenodomus tracheiphilus IPT5 TaxID=1408161 RepID=A0A6A7B7C4_9PLEO|nr:hypothetical protein T440DRAFT_489188 [Plenodomus tracheiphilus IPT5]